MPMFEHPSFVQLRQPSVHTTQPASGAAKIDFSVGLVDPVSGLDRSTANTNPTGCCAVTASAQAIAAPPSSAMNSRRFIRLPRWRAPRACREWQRGALGGPIRSCACGFPIVRSCGVAFDAVGCFLVLPCGGADEEQWQML